MMTTLQLIAGLVDIKDERIPLSCIIDMAPEIIKRLQEYAEKEPVRARRKPPKIKRQKTCNR